MKIFTTGGTIDKIYFDANSEFQVGEPAIKQLLQEEHVSFDYEVEPLMRKDSLELTDTDRQLIRSRVAQDGSDRILITHGTDTMVATAMELLDIEQKTIVLTGSMQPAKLRASDAVFNIGCAITAVQLLDPGVYIAMHGRVFDPRITRKNLAGQCFEEVS
ncbi:MAG: asparaginase domain-containing protein [Pseudomonadales bacterium]